MHFPIGMIAAGVAVPLVYGTLHRFFPPREETADDEMVEANRASFHRTEVVGMLLFFFVFIPLFGAAWTLLFMELSRLHLSGIENAIVIIRPSGLYWAFMAFLPAGISGAFAGDGLARIMQRGRFRQWLRYLELKYGFRQEGPGLWVLVVILAVPAVVLVMFTLNWYVVLTESGIRLNGWFSSERVYHYDDVEGIEMAEKAYANTDYVRRIYRFDFKDGTSWSTTPGLIAGPQDRWSEVAEIVSKRSGARVTTVDSLD